jgi:phosphoglycerate dehydrogenase-like enzyme
MSSAIVVSNAFEGAWPLVADHFHHLWRQQGDVQFVRLAQGDVRPAGEALSDAGSVTRLVLLRVALTPPCLEKLTALREVATARGADDVMAAALTRRGVKHYTRTSEGFWGESVCECALALTLCGLRRIPQLHRAMMTDLSVWNYKSERGEPGKRGAQFCDDDRFTNGTIAGKRVRVVGAGNIASRYAKYCSTMGADVAAYDPYVPDPSFHLAGARHEHHLERLVEDAEIFAPMVPLRDSTRGLVTAGLIDRLPKGCLVVLVTRARICDTNAIRRRVLADELALAADVHDGVPGEPIPLDDPILGRHNVVHTPHIAGRTRHANEQFAEMLASRFEAAS